ncbi:MAG: hypothetical protein OEW23_16980 [Candidatus Aminicenantes bacterium]|nr:hypothetical protein [Candidatus Aminicenantes bacterium]
MRKVYIDGLLYDSILEILLMGLKEWQVRNITTMEGTSWNKAV